MEIVINRCYGGFGLSPKAYKRVAEIQGVECYFFKGISDYVEISLEEAEKSGLFFSVKNIKNPERYSDNWHNMTDQQKDEYNQRYRDTTIDDFRGDRTNPILIQVVKELGEAASGQCAELEVLEIPDGIDYEIDDYDGRETVHEKHRSW